MKPLNVSQISISREYTVEEAATALGVSHAYVRGAHNRGELKSCARRRTPYGGTRMFFTGAQLIAWAAERNRYPSARKAS